MDLKVGLIESPVPLDIELPDDTDVSKLKKDLDAAISGGSTLWLTDKDGVDIGLTGSKIAFVRIGSADAARKIGFGV